MTWSIDPKENRAYAEGEVGKIRWEAAGWLQGVGLDIGCGAWKVVPHAIGVDRGIGHRGNIDGDVTRLLFADASMDFVFSSHCLEHIEDHQAALAEWWRVLKPGAHLVLYLPHKELYPNIGTKGANPAHKHDFLPEDIVRAMQAVAPDWVLRENQERAEGDECSFFQVYTKRKPGAGQGAALEESDPAKRAIAVRFGGFGDALVAASTFPHLKAEGWHLTVYTSEKGAEVLKHDPHVDRVVIHDALHLTQGELRAFAKYLRTRCARFVDFGESFECLLLANPNRPNWHWPHAMRNRYLGGNYLEAAHEVASVPQEYRQRFYESDAERIAARKWRCDKRHLVALAACGTGVNKFWPHVFEYAGRLVQRNPELHIVVLGDLKGARFFEHPQLHAIGERWGVRMALAVAKHADLVIGQETGILNAVALEPMPKLVLLSHSSDENLTKHWVNATPLTGEVTCYPCHRLHGDWNGCRKDPDTQLAACQAAIKPMPVVELTERLLRLGERAAA
jgi:ADP-heptose:LPS heptosyltransferase/predicted SAM-dependent methyltransferase